MATSAGLIHLLLAVLLLTECLCKECTNSPSSSHTIRQALLSSPSLSSFHSKIAELRGPLYTYPDLHVHANMEAMAHPLAYREAIDSVSKESSKSYRNPFAHRKKLGFHQYPFASKEAMMSHADPSSQTKLIINSMQFHEAGDTETEAMESDATRKMMKSDPLARREALEFDEEMGFEEPFLQEVSLHDVVLHPDSMQGRAQQTNLEYLLMLDVDNLVWSFRNLSNLSAPGSPYGGWESPSSELRGHFVGHYLSATAQMWASTHNQTLYDQMTAVLNALFECQQEIGTGYLSAFPSEFFDRFEEVRPVWAPYYTIHKIMAGLLDQYTFVGSTKALKMAIGMADYFNQRVLRIIDLYTIERHWQSLNEETGGMNDVLYRLYTLTNDLKYLKLAHLFDKPCFLGLLAVQADSLSGFHANTHIPVVIGAQMGFEITGQKLYKELSSFFMDIVNTSHSYPTGGTSAGEFWTDPLHLGETLSTTETEESCTSYNMLKVSRHLFRWTRQMRYADYYERLLMNGVLSIQRGQEPGVMIYMLPMGKGQSKAISYHGWGTKFESFWCCYGTGIESFSKLGDSIYFEETGTATPSLYIIQLVSSSLNWHSAGLVLNQKVEELSSNNASLHASFEFSEINNTIRGPNTPIGTLATLQIRVPFWVESFSGSVSLNNETLNATLTSGEFLRVTRMWQSGDKLELFLPVLLRTEKVKDDRSMYSSLHAIFFGPYLLAGMSNGDWDLVGVAAKSLTSWVAPVESTSKKMLYSFSQENTLMQDVVFLTHKHSSLSMGMRPREGTDEAVQSTFKLVDPVAANLVSESCLNSLLKGMVRIVKERVVEHGNEGYKDELVGELVSVEVFNQPGSFLMHMDSGRVEVTRVNVRQNNGEGCGHGSKTVFQIIPGLHPQQDYISFEAVSNPGCFLYTEPDHSKTVRLGCVASESDEHFHKAASFLIHRPLASYYPMSFIAKGTNKDYVLSPVTSFMDESYTIFFNITS
eukprot:c19966_g1_i1 orf=356-3310(-)